MGRHSAPKRERVKVPAGGWQNAKKPVLAPVPVAETKQAVVLGIDDDTISKRHLVWRFNEVDRSGPWPPAHIGSDAMGNLLSKMADYESMTLGEIFAPGSEHGKKYPTETLPSPAQRRLQEIEMDDETEIVRLRCGGKPRLYGILREHVFHVLWWDAEHQVFPSAKKHT